VLLAETEPCIACDGTIVWPDKQIKQVIEVIEMEIGVQSLAEIRLDPFPTLNTAIGRWNGGRASGQRSFSLGSASSCREEKDQASTAVVMRYALVERVILSHLLSKG